MLATNILGVPTPKAARTRAVLQETATRLFAEQGYDATTVEQIARTAGVSHMTFFRYFATKDAVILDDGFDPTIAAAVAATPSSLPPMTRVCTGLRAALSHVDVPDQEQVRQRVRIAAQHPVLRMGMYANTEATREALVAVLAEDGGEEFAARVAAAAVLAALTVALQEWCLSDDEVPMSTCLSAALGGGRRGCVMSALEVRDLWHQFDDLPVLRNVDLRVAPGEVHALIGFNGAGKSTLMRATLGMLRPDSGSVRLFGVRVPGAGAAVWSRVGHLIDTPFVYPELTVRENLWAAARLHGVPAGEVTAAVDRVVAELQLDPWSRRRASTLSLGNRQRVGLASALVHRPRLLVLDEPTNALDPSGVVLLRELLQGAARDGVAALVSSHHLDEVARIADRVSVIHAGAIVGELDPQGDDLERAFFAMAHAADLAAQAGAQETVR